MIRRATLFLRENSSKKTQVIAIGKKGRDTLRKRGVNLTGEYLNVSNRVDFEREGNREKIAELYAKRRSGCVYAVYNEFKNVMVQKLRVAKLLPIDPSVLSADVCEDAREMPWTAKLADEESLPHDRSPSGESLVDYIYEEPVEEIFNGLVPRYLEAEVFRILLESAAAEHAARMTAMDAATRNAAELIEKLTLEMNKIRQAGITKELIEIVSGAASANS